MGTVFLLNLKRVAAISNIFERNPEVIRKIDHIVYSVFDLDAAMMYFEDILGVSPIFGGYHKTFGTKNALINLDNGKYLELLAADDTNTQVPRPRWMGIDVLTKNQLTRWALKSDNLLEDGTIVKQYDPNMANISGGSRKTVSGSLLQWKLHMPLPLPEVEIAPFLIDWSETKSHPHDELPNMGCELVEMYGMHPDPDLYKETFAKLGLDFPVKKSKDIRLKAILKSPKGIVEI